MKAQVRIGGNTAPNAAAALDLNATDATNNGTKGLALPRVNLTSNTMQLTTGVTNLTGMLVYNTTTTLGQIGIFYWNGATWVKANLPSTSVADSGKFLMSNGTYAYWATFGSQGKSRDTLRPYPIKTYSGANLILDTVVHVTAATPSETYIPAPGLLNTDFCFGKNMSGAWTVSTNPNSIWLNNLGRYAADSTKNLRIMCFRFTV